MLKNIALSAVSMSLALGGALPVFAQTDVAVGANTTTGKKVDVKARIDARKATTAIDVPCIQAAVEKRDTAIIAGVDTYATGAKSALTVRKDALKAAWAQTEKKARKDSLRSAWDTYKKSIRTVRESFKKSQKSAWDGYKTEAKSCRATAEDEVGAGVDTVL